MKNKDINTYLENIKPKYEYYFDDKKADPFKHQPLNCSEEICPGSHERRQKIQTLKKQKIRIGDPDFTKKYGEIIHELYAISKEEVMAAFKMTEMEAAYWMDRHIDFNHVQTHEDHDGNKYLSIDPVVCDKYKEYEKMREILQDSLKS